MPHPRIRGLCHWAGEPAGHLGAELPSRRTAGPASARKSSSPCSHRLHGLFRARCANAVSWCLRALPFASSRRSLTRALGHLQWPEPPRVVHATASARQRLKRHRHRAIRSLDRYGGAYAIRDSPFDVAACHCVVRRHTCSPVTRRSTRATQAQAASEAHVGQPARTLHQKRAMRPATSPRSAWATRWQVDRSVASTVCHGPSQNVTIWPTLRAISEVGCT